jgi:hypothetical protein
MNFRLPVGVFLLVSVMAASAMCIPSYRMDSWTLLSDAIVLCDEEDVKVVEIEHEGWTEARTLVRCKVVESFKGSLEKGFEFTPDFDTVFRRHLAFEVGTTVRDVAGKIIDVFPPDYLAAGRVLLFLKKGKEPASWSVVTAKLIQKDAVYQFGQFQTNPGPLVLAPQGPENFQLSAGEKYDEERLIRDLRIALEKAATLNEPVPRRPNQRD